MSLALDRVSVTVPKRKLVDGISFDVSAGEVVIVLGPNGAGKTTLLRAIAGLIAHGGEIRWHGASLAGMQTSDRAKLLAYLPQGHVAHWPISVREAVAIGRFPHASSLAQLRDDDIAAIERALSDAGATHLANENITTLSGGERARVMLARALAVESPVLLADEPVAALDPAHQLTIVAMLQRLARRGRAIIAVLHDLALASRFADRVILMKEGRLIANGKPGDVLTDDHVADVFGVSVRRIKDETTENAETVLAWTPLSDTDG